MAVVHARYRSRSRDRYDVVIVGAGHNGLTAAAYLARAGRSVLVLEAADQVGGASVSSHLFPGVDAWMSRYSYLLSLLPERIVCDLGLRVQRRRRSWASYTPHPEHPERRGLLLAPEHDAADVRRNDDALAAFGAAGDVTGYRAMQSALSRVAQTVWPTLLAPLPTRSELRGLVDDDELWNALFEQPIGEFVRAHVADDALRGSVLTDALIGTFAGVDDPSLVQNRCFLYHVIGGGTGYWDVPVGGMGVVPTELARVAREHGARTVTNARVTAISPDGEVRYQRGDRIRSVVGAWVLSGVAPHVLAQLLRDGGAAAPTAPTALTAPTAPGTSGTPTAPGAPADRPSGWPEGAQVKTNLVVTRLPRLRDAVTTERAAFTGTFHVHESASELESAYRGALRGVLPALPPVEVYAHSLTDASILDPELSATGAQTLTVFGLHQADRWLSAANNDATRERLQRAVLDSLDSVLAEPVEPLLLRDAEGRPCIETRTTRDLETELGMPGGNIFHGALDWPFADDTAPLTSAAEQWGVASGVDRVLICGAGARRGGGVSGIGGHNAAMAVLQSGM